MNAANGLQTREWSFHLLLVEHHNDLLLGLAIYLAEPVFF